MKSSALSLSKIGVCTAIVFAMMLPTQASADTQPNSPEEAAEKQASDILDSQLDLTVEEALQMEANQGLEDATVEESKVTENGFEVQITRAGSRAMHVTCTGANSGGKALATPHYSKGAGGAIFKTNIKCTGYGALHNRECKTFLNPPVSSNDRAM